MIDAICAGPENDGEHVVERAPACMWLGIDGCFAGLAMFVQLLYENRSLEVKNIGVLIDCPSIQRTGGNSAVCSPALISIRLASCFELESEERRTYHRSL